MPGFADAQGLCDSYRPQDYLRHVIERSGDHPINRIEELLPWRVDLAINHDALTDEINPP